MLNMKSWIFVLLSLVAVGADIYDVDTNQQRDDYDDAWMGQSMDDFKHDQHNFKHRKVDDENSTPKTPSKKEKDVASKNARIRRALGLAYDDEWMSRPEMMKNKEFAPVKREAGDIEFGKAYNLPQQAKRGEYFEFHGVYSSKTTTFSVNLKASNGHYLLHMSFRPSYVLVMNSGLPGWGTEVRDSYPDFEDGKEFKLTILVDDDCYRIIFNDDLMSKSFPFRKPVSDVSYVQISGGNKKVRFTKIKMPDGEQHPHYVNRMAFNEKLTSLDAEVKAKIAGKSLNEVTEYVKSSEGSISVFTLELLNRIATLGDVMDVNDEHVSWILNNREILEMFMTSGDILNNKWKKAVNILAEIIKQDSNAKSGLKLRLAVATALSFAYPVHSQAVWSNLIDGIKRYHQFVKWAEDNIYFTPFYEGTAWHLRYIVGSWQTDEEHVWARENILADYKNEEKVADVTHKMVSYNLYNYAGVSVHRGAEFYDYKPMTLAIIHEYGAVCGGISRFAVGMAQAHGVPALMVGQPGHCAYIWYKNKKWVLGNDISGWSQSSTHGYIQYTWKRPSPFFPVMEKAQMNLDNYRLSEKLRLASKFAKPEHQFALLEAANTLCPHNYDVWMDLEVALEQPDLLGETVHTALSKTLINYREEMLKVEDLAIDKPVNTDCSSDQAYRIVNGGSQWTCTKTEVTFEVDLQGPKSINELKIWWWGQSKAGKYDVFAANKDGAYTKVKSEADESVDGWFNHWSTITGWDARTYKIKFLMREGKKDFWGFNAYFGIRKLIINGRVLDELTNVGLNKPSNSDEGTPSNLNDGDASTTWSGFKFSMDLQRLTSIHSVDFDTNGNTGPLHLKYGIEPNMSQKDFGEGSVAVTVNGIGSEMEVSFETNVNSIKEVAVQGVSYSAKDILKMRVNKNYNDNAYVKEDLKYLVDSFEYDN